MKSYPKLLCLLLLCFMSPLKTAHAWLYGISLGYGYGKEVDQDYKNHGFVLTAKFYKFPNIDEKLIATLDATLANITASTDTHTQLTTAACSLAMRAYFNDPSLNAIRPYLQASFGPALLSNKELGNRSQGSHFAFQTALAIGSEMDKRNNHFDINLGFIHFCNAGIFHPNQGINLAPILSVGYLF